MMSRKLVLIKPWFYHTGHTIATVFGVLCHQWPSSMSEIIPAKAPQW